MNRAVLPCVFACLAALASTRETAAQTTYPEFRLTPSPPPDRQVHPFEGSLGRPCGLRWRATPSGTRKVRVCY